jgi:flagellar hook-associated protein 1 FlgK
MTALSIGLSGLSASQKALDAIGQNIANANTPEYHRQVVDLATRSVGLEVGSGVEVRSYRRLGNSLLDQAVSRNTTETAFVTSQLETLRQAQSVLASGEGSVHDLLEKFFNQLEQLSARPSDTAQRRVVLNSARDLTDKLNALNSDLMRMSDGLDEHITRAVEQINTITPRVAELNLEIQRVTIHGVSANDLKDQRDQLVRQLAEFMNLQIVPQDFGMINVIGGGSPLVIAGTATPLQFAINSDGDAAVRVQGLPIDLRFEGGKLAGYLQIRNGDLAGFRERLDTLSESLVRELDGTHATGLGLTGPFTFLAGQRPVTNPLAALENAGLGFPPTTGTLYVSLTNLATGQRTLHEVAVDPVNQSLQDFAADFTAAVGNAQAVVDGQTNTLRIIAQPGYAVDFAGRLPTAPENPTLTGTATASILGRYSGTANDTYTFEIAGNGTVGVTPNLALNVRDGSGALLKTLTIGEGYEPGSDLETINGVVVRLSAGSVNVGETFEARVVAQPDTAGILTALGINTLFAGRDASSITVRQDLVENPALLASALTDQKGDASNLRRLAGLRDKQLLSSGTQTFREFYAAVVGDVGSRVQDLDQQQTAKQALGANLQAQRQAVSGVDPNEELVHMLTFQRAFQMSAQFLSTVNQTLEELVNILR